MQHIDYVYDTGHCGTNTREKRDKIDFLSPYVYGFVNAGLYNEQFMLKWIDFYGW